VAGVDFDSPIVQRVTSLGIVVLLHVLVVVLLITQSATVSAWLPQVMAVRIIQQTAPKPPVPKIEPKLPTVVMEIPVPEVQVAPPPTQTSAPRAVIRVGPAGPPASHFGTATGDAGLGVQVATTTGGGTRARGSLGDFDAAVKRAILARKVQPTLAWDVRQTCVVGYSVTIARGGALAGFKIDPCAISEINHAAEAAIRQAAPFADPPDLGASTYTVHGSLIFHP
jgi:outer membrane biosynthesis protein TonB